MAKGFNTTDLDPEATFERHVFHRDQFAHFLRWVHVLKEAKIGEHIVDFGCGRGNLLEVLYRNRFKPASYVGLDIREQTLQVARERFAACTFPVEFRAADLTAADLDVTGLQGDKVCSFEVLEHVGRWRCQAFLRNFAACGRAGATYYLSTPNYDEHVGAADNHTYDAGDGQGAVPQEWGYDELEVQLKQAGFEVVDTFGTFASQRDYKPHLLPWQAEMLEALKRYYDANLVANLMAPVVPARHARNTLWVLQHPGTQNAPRRDVAASQPAPTKETPMPAKTVNDLAPAILADRQARKLSQGAYGELLGLSGAQLRNLEQGRALKPGEREKILAVLQSSPVPASLDLGGDGEPALGGVQGAPPAPGADIVIPPVPEEWDWDGPQLELWPLQADLHVASQADEAQAEQQLFAASTGPDPRQQYSLAPYFDLSGDGVRRVSNGELATWRRCERKWYLTNYRALGLPREKLTGALALGTRVHAALAAAYDPAAAQLEHGSFGVRPVEVALGAFNTTIAADYDTLSQEHDLDELPAYLAELLAEADLGRAMLEGYFEWLAETGIDVGYEVVGPEQVLEVDAGFGLSRPVHLIAKLDLRLVRQLDSARMFLDFKTAASLTQGQRLLHMNRQMLQYALVEWLALLESGADAEGVRTGGAIYRMLKKVKRTPQAKPPFYDQVELHHSVVQLQSYWSQVRGTVERLLEVTARLDAGGSHHELCPPSPADDCTWSCDMFALCPMLDDSSRAQDYISEQLVVVNPLARYEHP